MALPSLRPGQSFLGVALGWQTISSATTAQAGDRLQCDTSAGPYTLTLPASAPEGTIVWIADPKGTWAANNLTVAGNDHAFDGGDTTLTCDVNDAELHLRVSGGLWRY